MRDVFEGMASVDISGVRIPRLEAGEHLCRIVRCTVPKRSDTPAFIVELEIVKSTTHPAGEERSVYIASKFLESFQRSVSRFCCAASGLDPRDDAQAKSFQAQASDVGRAAIGANNPLGGRLVVCTGVPGKSINPKTGTPYVDYLWSPAEQTAPAVATFVAPPAAPPMQLSPDGKWRWNGTAWEANA